jgi:hypothetical protein
MTQKNKIFSIILSLLVLSSVACRKSGGGNGGGVVTEPDALPGTFSITEASGNVKALVVKPDTTVSDIKIAFSSSADYTAEFTVEDSETVEANKITSEDFEFANNSLTAKTTLVDKVRKLDSSSKSVEKTIKINFTFKAKDTTLKNNTKTLSIEVKLTKELAFKPSSLVGSWTFDGDTSAAGNNTLKVEDNTITVRLNGVDATIDTSATWNDEKDKEVTVYQKSSEETDKGAVGKATHTVKFTSATICSASLTTEKSGNFNANFKKQQ